MSKTEKPKALTVGCVVFDCFNTEDGPRGQLHGKGLVFTQEEAKFAISWLQEFVDYAKTVWVPKVGEFFRHENSEDIYMRLPGEPWDYAEYYPVFHDNIHDFPCLRVSGSSTGEVFMSSKNASDYIKVAPPKVREG